MSDAYAASMSSAVPLVQVRPLLRRVYLYMALGLAVTAIVSYWTVTSPAVLSLILTNYWLFWAIFIVQLIMVGILSVRVMSLSLGAALGIFLVYAALNGRGRDGYDAGPDPGGDFRDHGRHRAHPGDAGEYLRPQQRIHALLREAKQRVAD
jgi:hypothetical protein